jgi:hypothetical protein
VENAAVTVTEAPPPSAVHILVRQVEPLVPTFTREAKVNPVTELWIAFASALITFATTTEPLGGVKLAVTSDVAALLSP